MKKNFYGAAASLFVVSLFFSACSEFKNYEVPESISIKSVDAKYSLPLGSAVFKLADRFNAEEIQKAVSDNDDKGSSDEKPDETSNSNKKTTKITVYEYIDRDDVENAADPVIEYLMCYPVVNQDVSGEALSHINSYLEAFRETLAATGLLTEEEIENQVDEKKTEMIDSLIESLKTPEGTYVFPLQSVNSEISTGINFKKIIDSFGKSKDEEESEPAEGGEEGGDEAEPEKIDYGKVIFNKIGFSGINAFAYIQCAVEGADVILTYEMNEEATAKKNDKTGKIMIQNYMTDEVFSGTKVTKVLADCDNEPEDCFSTVETDVDLSEKADEKGIIEDGSFMAPGCYTVKLDGEALTDFINGDRNPETGEFEKHENCILSYDLCPVLVFNAEEAIRAFLDSPSVNIGVDIIIRFPLKMKILDDIVIDDVMDLSGRAVEDDLLDRDEGSDEFNKYSEIIKEISIEYKFVNTTGMLFSASLNSNIVDGVKIIEEKELQFDGEKHTILLSSEEISNIMTKPPFQPKIRLAISKTDETKNEGYLKITRNAEFGAWAIFAAVTGGTCEIWSKSVAGNRVMEQGE